MFKASRFNFWASLQKHKHLLFNGASSALYEFDDYEHAQAVKILNAPNKQMANNALHVALLEGKFIIRDYVDEGKEFVKQKLIECDSQSDLDFDICPTYECNFRCKYCDIDFTKGRMSSVVESAVIKYLEFVLPRYYPICIYWYGGEPLLCIEKVVRISRQIKKIAHQHGIEYNNILVTNGYLLNLVSASRLFAAGVNLFHITIDGTDSYHDQLRVLNGGKPTHATIMQNLVNILNNLSEVTIKLRINVNETNIYSVNKLLDQVPPIFRSQVQVDICPIRGPEPTSLTLYRKINQTNRYALQAGYQCADAIISTKRKIFCPADKPNNFQIGPDGTLYKCSPSRKPEVKCGYLNAQGIPELNDNNKIWHQVPTVFDYCLECPYLYFCCGGCRLQRLRGNKNLTCQDRYKDMQNLIINRYISICRKN